MLGCCLIEPGLLTDEGRGIRSEAFYDLRHRTLWEQLQWMAVSKSAIDMITVQARLKNQKLLDSVGGLEYLAGLPDKVPSAANLKYYLDILLDKLALRKAVQVCTETVARVYDYQGAAQDLLQGIHADLETLSRLKGDKRVPFLDIISPKEARDYACDPADFMLGENLINRGFFVTIVGDPGCGKSRLLTTLAVAGARGNATWQGYEVRSKWKTLILQNENEGNRLKCEFDAVPAKLDDQIRISRKLNFGLAFLDPGFRDELRAYYDRWPFEMLGIDPWNDVSFDTGQKEFKEALTAIRSVFYGVKKMPAIVIVAHMRKKSRDDTGHASGRELLHWISGSLALGSTSRTVFAVQPVTHEMDDTRIVFEVAKANDADPQWLRKFGTRLACHRANGAFQAIPDFDWDGLWDNAHHNATKRKVTADMVLEAFGDMETMTKSALAKAIKQNGHEVGESTVMKAIGSYLEDLVRITPQGFVELVRE